MERLQKIIAAAGVCSRRKAEELILAGRVSLNGTVVSDLGTKAEPEDEILVDGEKIGSQNKVVYVLNKPKNVISSARDDRGRTTVTDLIDSPYRLFPIGRLDFDSSGLILMSNDGELMQRLTHPKYEVEKTYEVTIDHPISDEEMDVLMKGVKVDDYVTAPCTIELVSRNEKASRMKVTIHEGKNREIRKMFMTLNYTVTRLHRIKEATIELGNLRSGEYRLLKPHELVVLKRYLDGFNR